MSPRSESQFEQMRANSRKAILDSALELFSKRGFANTTTLDIAKEAGISKGLIYNYFHTKEEILESILEQGFERTIGLMNQIRSEVPAEEQLHQLLRTWIEVAKTDSRFLRLTLSLHLNEEYLYLLEKKGQEYMELFSRPLFEIFRRLGSDNPEIDTLLFGSIIDGIGLNYSASPDLVPIDSIIERLIHLYIHHQD
jgi:AcrR family transcriptional regulator